MMSSSSSEESKNCSDGLVREVLIQKKSMLHRKAHPQAVLESLQDMAAVVAAQLRTDDGQWRSHDLLNLLKATDIGKVVNGLRKYPSRRVAALAKEVLQAWKHTVASNILMSAVSPTSTRSTSPPPTPHSADCPASPYVYVVIDDDEADEVLIPPSSNTQLVTALTTSPPVPSALTKSMLACQPREVITCSDAAQATPIARKRSFMSPSDTPLFSNISTSTASYQAKLEAAKRKLHVGYERDEAAKRQHTICLLRLDQLPPDNTAARKPAHATLTLHQRDHCKGSIQLAAPTPTKLRASHVAPQNRDAFVRAH